MREELTEWELGGGGGGGREIEMNKRGREGEKQELNEGVGEEAGGWWGGERSRGEEERIRQELREEIIEREL